MVKSLKEDAYYHLWKTLIFVEAMKILIITYNKVGMFRNIIDNRTKYFTQDMLLYETYIPKAGLKVYFKLRGMVSY